MDYEKPPGNKSEEEYSIERRVARMLLGYLWDNRGPIEVQSSYNQLQSSYNQTPMAACQ